MTPASPATATPEELRAALLDMQAVSVGFVGCAHPTRRARRRLAEEISRTAAIRKAAINLPVPTDPNVLIEQFLSAGGDWGELIAAISAAGMRGDAMKWRAKK